jgi:hypothetical protein
MQAFAQSWRTLCFGGEMSGSFVAIHFQPEAWIAFFGLRVLLLRLG